MKTLSRVLLIGGLYLGFMVTLGAVRNRLLMSTPVWVVANGMLFVASCWVAATSFSMARNPYVRGVLGALLGLLLFVALYAIGFVLLTYLLWRDQ